MSNLPLQGESRGFGSRRPSQNIMNSDPIVRRESTTSNTPGAISVSSSISHIDINNPNPQVVDVVQRHLADYSSSLQTPGGDITRDLYKWTNDKNNNINNNNNPILLQESIKHSPDSNTGSQLPNNLKGNFHRKRSMSFSAVSTHSDALNSFINNSRKPSISGLNRPNIDIKNISNSLETQRSPMLMTHEEIRAPGGFRRAYVMRRRRKKQLKQLPPNFITRNFIEFLTLYGHFAGEDLSESDDESEDEINLDDEEEAIESENESSALLATGSHQQDTRSQSGHKTTTVKAVLLLLKSFVGTGVLFLPKAFHNGGWGFSALCLFFCAFVSFYCFLLLIITKDKIGVNGYGEMGQLLYGKTMKLCILSSIALSQVGFAAAYTVFTATNLQVYFQNVLKWNLNLGFYIWFQALVFIPLALTRNIAKLSGTALIADFFILLGLVYVYYYSTYYVISNGVATQSMVWFNKSNWSLFIGTAIFTFEGIGLLIPIQESMKYPELFHKSLSGVMITVTIIFISCGLLCYSAFGNQVETVVLLNFPQDSPITALIQLLYALAILLSTPLQLFPAIRILEQWTFPSHLSGKYNQRVKWLKNYFRCGIVILTTLLAWGGANDLDKFVSLVGSVACIPLIYIHPPLLHFKSFKNDSNTSKWTLLIDLLIVVLGVVMLIYTSWQTLLLWITD